MAELFELPALFNAHIELRRLLTGRLLPQVPFTPIERFDLPLLVDAPSSPVAFPESPQTHLETIR